MLLFVFLYRLCVERSQPYGVQSRRGRDYTSGPFGPLNPSKTIVFLKFLHIFALEASSFIIKLLSYPSSPSWGHLGAILGHFWVLLGPSWGDLGASVGHLGSILVYLGPSWGHLGPILGPSWASWAVLGPFWGHLGAILGGS